MPQHILEVFSYCPRPTDQKEQSNIEDVAWTRLTARGQIQWSLLLFSCRESHNKLLPWITPCVPPSHSFDQAQDIVNNRYTQACAVCAQHKCVSRVSFWFPKVENETSLKKKSSTAPSAHPDCFLDSSRDWIPRPSAVAFGRPVALYPVVTRDIQLDRNQCATADSSAIDTY